MSNRLQGKVALVTAAGQGIGRAIAEASPGRREVENTQRGPARLPHDVAAVKKH